MSEIENGNTANQNGVRSDFFLNMSRDKTGILVLENVWPYFLIVIAVFLAYANSFHNAFIFDDQKLIVENEFLRHWESVPTLFRTPIMAGSSVPSDFYRPLQVLFYLIVFQLGGLSAFGFHLLNVTLHACNACLVYKLGRSLNFEKLPVIFAALLWGLHPIHTEAITYISGTADPLFVFFGLLSLLVLVPSFSLRRFITAAFFLVCGLLSKETAVVFPVLSLMCIFMTERRRELKIYLRSWPLWTVVGIYLVIRFVVMPFNPLEFVNVHPELHEYGAHPLLRIYTFFATVPAYLGLIVWPFGLHMERQFPVLLFPNTKAVLGIVILLMVGIQVLRAKISMRLSPVGFGLIWAMTAHLPDTGLLLPMNAVFLEHWMYLPTVGLSLGTCETIKKLIAQRGRNFEIILAALAVVVVTGAGVITHQQNKIWHDGVSFYENILDHGENSVRAHNNLGTAYAERGEYAKALEQFGMAISLGDFYPETHQNIASVYSHMPDGGPRTIPQEIIELKRALEIDPNYFLAALTLAGTYRYLQDDENARYYQDMADHIRQYYQTGKNQ